MATVTTQNSLIQFGFRQTFTYGIGQSVLIPVPLILNQAFGVSGSLADQCSKIYNPAGGLTFVASTPQIPDLTSLTDPLGNALSFSGVRFIAIRNNSKVDGVKLLVGNAGANEWDGIVSNAGTLPVWPSTATNDGFVVFQIPNTTAATVDGTHKLLKLDPGANAFNVDIMIAGF